MKRYFRNTLLVIGLIAIAVIVVDNYSYIFSKTVEGEIIEVERVTDPTTIIGSGVTPQQMYSFAVAIRDQTTGVIYSASSEDRQWAIAKKNYCAKATFYPYPPWRLEKGGTYFGARLDQLRDCQHTAQSAPSASAQAPAASPSPSATP